MVRLKVCPADHVSFRIHISIPYGSIKSDKLTETRKKHGISIPYGSIKRGRILTLN